MVFLSFCEKDKQSYNMPKYNYLLAKETTTLINEALFFFLISLIVVILTYKKFVGHCVACLFSAQNLKDQIVEDIQVRMGQVPERIGESLLVVINLI